MRYLSFFLALLLLTGCGGRDKKAYVTTRTYERDTTIAYPYISGDLFRFYSDHIVDETHIPFSPKAVQAGDKIFVKAKYLGKFFKHMHPHIRERYVLITGNGDEEVPGAYAPFLEDEKILMWFGMNATVRHPKLKPIPIGPNGNGGKASNNHELLYALYRNPPPKERLLYLNVTVPNHEERARALSYFSEEPYCFCDFPRPLPDFLKEMMRSKYTLCPRGNGIDTHRAWEALLVGSIPILKSNGLDPLYADLPVLIVEEWSAINEAFLEEKYAEILSKEYKWEKLYADYWLTQIDLYSRKNEKRAVLSEVSCVNPPFTTKLFPTHFLKESEATLSLQKELKETAQ